MKAMVSVLLLVCSAVGLGAAVDLQAKYPFSAVLFDEQGQYYGLHWNFTRSTETIYFAVNVSTTGWVGLGLSPNGQMPGSDVVIGWVSNAGQGILWDRYAEGRFLPPIDTVSQDWFLTNSEEENGYTVLEFFRKFTSCDPQDLDVAASTARVVWSFSMSDPTEMSGSDARRHDYKGSRSVNLIGGTPSVNREASENEPFLDFTVTNVAIPRASTTYWCETFRIPQQFEERQHYINRFGPSLTSHPRAYVHHIIIYQCSTPLSEGDIGVSMPCNRWSVAASCRTGLVIGGWAVGGEDFLFPKGIAYPIGGTREAMIEMHYDNPDMTEGVIDNSGMRFYYTTEAPEINAGSISLGHIVTPYMLVPPGSRNFTIAGICSADCTQRALPPEGITIFANNFHTHLAGRGLTIQHFRPNTECNVLEELEPIDQNLKYDFNFQQSTILPQGTSSLAYILVLKCFYETTDRTTVTYGGASTREEMCLSFSYYYPRPVSNIVEACQSAPSENSFNEFYYTLLSVDPAAARQFVDPDQFFNVLNGLDWAGNPVLTTALESSIINSTGTGICYTTDGQLSVLDATLPVPGCSYQAPSRCGSPEPLTCCERAGATSTHTSVGIGSFILFLITIAVY